MRASRQYDRSTVMVTGFETEAAICHLTPLDLRDK